MDAADYLSLVSRWLHILSAIVLVGGTLYMRIVAAPILQAESDQVAEMRRGMRQRWSRWVGITAGLLILSGTYNLVVILRADSAPGPVYHMLLTVKLLLALAIFFFASVLAGRSNLAERFQQREVMWLNILAGLAVVLVCIAGAMKMSPRLPKDAEATSTHVAPLERFQTG